MPLPELDFFEDSPVDISLARTDNAPYHGMANCGS